MAAATTKSAPPRLLDKYQKEIVGELGKKFKRENRLSLPRLRPSQRSSPSRAAC